jgi:hypothetical protein
MILAYLLCDDVITNFVTNKFLIMRTKKENKAVNPNTSVKNTAASEKANVSNINNAATPPSQRVKARSGRGLANEGTNVSYDEER